MKKLVVLLLALAVIGLAVYADDAMAAPAPAGTVPCVELWHDR